MNRKRRGPHIEAARPALADTAAELVPAPLGPGHDHVDVSAAAFRADEPLAPFRDRHLGAITLRLLGSIRLDLVLARLAPHGGPHRPWRRRRASWVGRDRASLSRAVAVPGPPAAVRNASTAARVRELALGGSSLKCPSIVERAARAGTDLRRSSGSADGRARRSLLR
jgi:hypothetical protein